MPVFGSKTVYAGVVGYTSGTVVWTLDWAETSPGTIPVIDTIGLPQEHVGIIFSNPDAGGARGTATVTATVDGIPAAGGITALIPTDFIYYGNFSIRNGFDGDVGIAGYIGPSNPFVTPFIVAFPNLQSDDSTSFDALTIPLSQDTGTGGGNPASVVNFVTPMNVGLLTTDIGYNDFFNRRYYLPMKAADYIWVVGTSFPAYGAAFTVEIVVGFDQFSGEKYICSGNSTSDPTGFINIERVAWSGDR